MEVASIGSPALYLGFIGFVLVMLALDLGVFHRKAHEVKPREAIVWSLVWIGLAMVFNLGLYFGYGKDLALEFLTGYLVEKSLSIDNIFVFIVIFASFSVPRAYQHRVLFWGILGALVMRAVMIAVGAALLSTFHWVIYVFGALMIYTGWKLLAREDSQIDPANHPAIRLLRRLIPVTEGYRGSSFLVREKGIWMATPLLLVLVSVELTDVVFAIDSIPAIFAITNDPFIVFTSNIFAILGLRSLFFLLAGVIHQLRYMKHGLALVLMFVGVKMLLVDVYKIPVAVSLSVIAVVLGGSVILSLLRPSEPEPAPNALPAAPKV